MREELEVEPIPSFVSEANKAFIHMPEGKSGIVLGSGEHTNEWQKRGWQAMDYRSEENWKPDIQGNIRDLTSLTQENYDYMYAERIPFAPEPAASDTGFL